MKFLLVSPDFLPSHGGVATMTHSMASSLVDSGHTVYVMSPFAETPVSRLAGYHYIYDAGARPEVMSGKAWTDSEQPRVMQKLDEVVAEFGIERILSFHPHYYGQALMSWKYARLKKGVPPPSIGSVYHGLELLTCLKWPKIKQGLHERFLQRRSSHRAAVLGTVKYSDMVFCNSQYTESLTRRIAPSTLSAVIGCGVSGDKLDLYTDISAKARAARRLVARRHLGLPEGVMLIGTVARLVPHKNIKAVVDLIADSPNSVHGLIAGVGPQKGNLVAQIREAGIESRVHFRDIPDVTEKWQAIEALDQFLLLSKPCSDGAVEGFGIVMLEAMVAGVPVISSGTGGMGDVINHTETGLIASLQNRRRIMESSQSLLTDIEMQKKIVTAAQKRVSTEFLWTHVCRRLLTAWSLS